MALYCALEPCGTMPLVAWAGSMGRAARAAATAPSGRYFYTPEENVLSDKAVVIEVIGINPLLPRATAGAKSCRFPSLTTRVNSRQTSNTVRMPYSISTK